MPTQRPCSHVLAPRRIAACIAPLALVVLSSETASCVPWPTRAIETPKVDPSLHVAPCRGHGAIVLRKPVTLAFRWRYTSRSGVTTVKDSHVSCAWKLCGQSYRRTRARHLLSSHTSRDWPSANRALLRSSGPLPCRNYAPNQICSLGYTALRKQMHG